MNEIGARIDAVETRLAALTAPDPGARTEPDPGATETWEGAQVWAHIAEFGDYWMDQIDVLLASPDAAPPFGRVKSDPGRVAAIQAGRARPATEHLQRARAALARLRATVEGFSPDTWARTATHSTLGVLTMERIVEEFLIGHYEQHAAQLDAMA